MPSCKGGYCDWACRPERECTLPADCLKTPHEDCPGDWTCEQGFCDWACKKTGGPANDEMRGPVFIEYVEESSGEVIAGSYPYTFKDESSYSYDKGSRTIERLSKKDKEAHLLFGHMILLSGDLGEGREGVLYPIDSLPEEISDITISRVWQDGRAAVDIRGEAVILSPGETWQETFVEEKTGPYKTGIIRVTNNESLTNYGFLTLDGI